ncbi:unnamed protein product [Cyclocybe aegerita]|uniref:ABM domain-containing protein n=1 Tax=Cyclocybe aegerita TaxID=1973307 RepID=A0A8S0W562_CYCAE|nr:unnamed protein product [Cyclocybe aegerita]
MDPTAQPLVSLLPLLLRSIRRREAMPILEICQWKVSKAFLEDPSSLGPAFDQVSAATGCHGVYSGLAEEDKESVWLFIPWDTYEHHQTLIKDPSYPSLIEKLKPSFATNPKDLAMSHVDFNEDTTPGLTAPCTEVVKAVLKDGKTKTDLDAVMADVGSRIEAEKGSYPPVVWGPTIEDPNVFFLVVGWDSSKTHFDVVGQESFKIPLQNLRETADLHMVHVSFKKHPSS